MRRISCCANFRPERRKLFLRRKCRPVVSLRLPEERIMPEDVIAWHAVCPVDEIDEEDVAEFWHAGELYAIYHTPSGFYATDGLCTHEEAPLTGGLVLGEIIECPMHQGRFDIPSGKAKGAPVCINLRTYPTKVEAQQLYVGIPINV